MAGNNYLYITYIEKLGSFLKVWGQMDRNMPLVLEKSLSQMTAQFDNGLFMPDLEHLKIGFLCCAKYKDGAYYRARIMNIAMLTQNVVEVHFIDYGNKDIIPIANLRTIANFAPGLITIPPQAREFVIANVTHKGPGWDNDTISLICSEIRYLELAWVIVGQIGTYTLIKLFKDGDDALATLFNRGLILSIATTAQQMILQNVNVNLPPVYHITPTMTPPIAHHAGLVTSLPPTATPMMPPVTISQPVVPTVATYKAVSLEPGSENNVYVSYVSDGPCHFSVQLQKLEDSLARLMKELNRMNLQPLEDDPIPGTVCVARCLEDEHICRAVVTSMVDGQYKVFYVDFGNTEVVPLDNLYQIPFKYVIPKVMAMRYALAGLERSSVTLEMKCAFKEFVSDKLLKMHALPPPTRSALPLCVLWNDKNINVLDVLRRAALLAYPEVVQLTRGFSQEVRVSYVHSCSHFYVQIKPKEEELRKVMADLQTGCPHANTLNASQIKIGMPCCALFDADAQWYRAQILSKDDNTVKVRYVDYGNEETVSVHNLRIPNGELLTALRPQALECCLNGYQNMEDDTERDSILEELILEKEFVMKVVEMQGNRALVELIDGARYNVASLLLERLATARSQVSPLLIQDSHYIEQRKRNSPTSTNVKGFQQRLDRKPSRDLNEEKGWGDNQDFKENNRQESWRQSKPPRSDQRSGGGDNFDRTKGRKDDFKKNNWGGNDDDFKKGGWNANGFKKDDNWGNKKDDSWGNKKDDHWGNKKDDSWGNKKDDSWGNKKDDSWGNEGSKKSNWNTNNDSSPNWKRGGKSPNQSRDGSEKGNWSDAGSEKNWRRSPRSNNEDQNPRNKFDSNRRTGTSFNNSSNFKNRDNPPASTKKVTDPAPANAEFTYPQIANESREVIVSWFHDPSSFFCQLLETQEEFRKMMNDIQTHYVSIKPDHAVAGAPVIAVYPDDSIMYRGRVLEAKGLDYRVQYVDFGNVCITSKVWPIEKKFMTLPAQAIYCGLNGIAQLGEAWPTPDIFSSYFTKDSITCSFAENQNLKYSVELTCDGQSISETLVSAGLAAYATANSNEIYDPSILLGQQIRVVIVEIEAIDVFYVELQNGLSLLCTLHNLQSATEKHEEVLRNAMGLDLIMYVDNILEEKIEVTLYDTSGNKLSIIEPDEGAYDTIEKLCPLPVVYSTITGWISYFMPVENEKFRIFIQPSEYATTLAQLLDNMFTHYNESEAEESLEVEVGKMYVVHSTDSNWYRGQVESVEDENVKVLYVDYGNSETVSSSQLRNLAPQFIVQHILALEVSATNIDESFIEQEVIANVWYGDAGWVAEIKKVNESSKIEHSEIAAQPAVVEEVEDSNVEPPCITDQEVNKVGVPIILSHVDSPNEFYIQLSEDLENINNLQEALQEQVTGFAELESRAAGVLCAAQHTLDQKWYRAQVLDADADITTVRFVDYGNTDVLDTHTSVKTLPPELLSLEQHARRCSLIVKATDAEWGPIASERFEKLTKTEDLSAEIIHQDEKTTFIELYANDHNVAEILLQEGLAIKLQLETESSCTGYVCHSNSPSEFWIQLESSVADLEWIAEQLSTAESFPELEDYTPGSLCAALYPDDEMWYRARILSNTIAGLEVLFIDYGNSCTCTGLRQLPEDLIMLPALAQKCSLQKPAGMLQWSTNATEDFKNLSADGATIFNIVKFSTGETSLVQLLLDGVDISTKLISPKQDAYITFYESVSSFWLQNVDDKVTAITSKLIEAPEWPKYEYKDGNSVVAALESTDEQWYRARILSEKESGYEVLFIDFGNTSISNDIRVLPSDIEIETPLANQCKLEPLPGFRWNDETSNQLAELYNDGSTLFQVEYVSSNTVRLYINGNDIRADLDSTSISSVHSTPIKSSLIKRDIDNEDLLDDNSELHILSAIKVEDSLSTTESKISTNTEDYQTCSNADDSEIMQYSEEIIDNSKEISNSTEASPKKEVVDDFQTSSDMKSEGSLFTADSTTASVNTEGDQIYISEDTQLSEEVDNSKLDESDEIQLVEEGLSKKANLTELKVEDLETDETDIKSKHNITIESKDDADMKIPSIEDQLVEQERLPKEVNLTELKLEKLETEEIDIKSEDNIDIQSKDDVDIKISSVEDQLVEQEQLPKEVDLAELNVEKLETEEIDIKWKDNIDIQSKDDVDIKISSIEDQLVEQEQLPKEVDLAELNVEKLETEEIDIKSKDNIDIQSKDDVDIKMSSIEDQLVEQEQLPKEVDLAELNVEKLETEEIDIKSKNNIDIQSKDDVDIKISSIEDQLVEQEQLPKEVDLAELNVEKLETEQIDIKSKDNIDIQSKDDTKEDESKDIKKVSSTEVTVDNLECKEEPKDVIGNNSHLLSNPDISSDGNEISVESAGDAPPSPINKVRRSSTPHCERIVPGSICRGEQLSDDEKLKNGENKLHIEDGSKSDIKEVLKNDNDKVTSEEEIVPDVIESEINKLDACKQENRNDKSRKNVDEHLRTDVASSPSNIDERIVPGAISRGASPSQ